MFELTGKSLIYAIDQQAHNISAKSALTGHEWMQQPGHIWKAIYAVPGTERVEDTIWADEQTPVISQTESEITVRYDSLIARGRVINAKLVIHLVMTDAGLRAWVEMENNDPEIDLMEIQLYPISGVRSLDGDPENDYVTWPACMWNAPPRKMCCALATSTTP